MTNKLQKYAVSLMLGMGLATTAFTASTANAAEIEVSGDLGIYSQYVWRGQAQGGGESSVQGDYAFGITEGLSANVWFATLGAGNVTEFDYTIDYSGEVGDFGYSVGAIAYEFMNQSSANAQEVYLGASYSVASVTAYYNDKLKDMWVDLGAATEFGGYAFDVTASYNNPDVGTSEFVNVALGISKEITVADAVLSPSFAYHKHMGALDTVATPDVVVFGINVGY